MLLAEIHGHIVKEAEGSEDYLTSAVFGHLRYLLPDVFWEDFFSKAKGLPVNGVEKTLSQAASEAGANFSKYNHVQIHFWPSHPMLGEPDMVFSFTGPEIPTLVVVVEVKLWSEKSGVGEFDQLARYLRLLDDLSSLQIGLSEDSIRFLLYLTPRESIHEISETLNSNRSEKGDEQKVFRVQWQDLLVSAIAASRSRSHLAAKILPDVARFLKRRGLEYFRGFEHIPALDQLTPEDGSYYLAAELFKGFTSTRHEFENFVIQKAGWVQ